MGCKDTILYAITRKKNKEHIDKIKEYVIKVGGSVDKIVAECLKDKELTDYGYYEELMRVLVCGAVEEISKNERN